nr:ATP-binding protein [Ramlibacter aurantiacus]
MVQTHQHRLYRFIVKHIGWGTDAEEITQQAFVEAAQSYASFRGASELSTWLYHEDPSGTVLVEARIVRGAICVSLTDSAPPFNPLLVPEPDTTLALEERQIGGLGLLFVRRTADRVKYRLLDGDGRPPRNQVCFSKRLHGAVQHPRP